MAEAFDYEALLQPLPEDAGGGVDLKAAGVHDQIKVLRQTDDPEGAVAGNLRKGEARVADWKKVVEFCSKELASRSRDLQLAAWLGEGLARQRGAGTLQPSLALTASMIESHWPLLYPRVVEAGDLDMRAGRLEEFDRLLSKTFSDFKLTKPVNGETFPLFEWQQCRKLEEDAARIQDPDQKQEAQGEARRRREALDNGVDKTEKNFYLDLHASLTRAAEELRRLRAVTEQAFRDDPGYGTMEDLPPTFSGIGSALEGFTMVVEEIVERKGGFPVEAEAGAEGGEASIVGADGVARIPGSIHPINRADAIERLNAVAEYFQKTEPHSPVAYLVLRAARWGQMSLPVWLEEVLGDPTALARVRETLGIRESEESG